MPRHTTASQMLTDRRTDGRAEWGKAKALSQIGWLGAKICFMRQPIDIAPITQKELSIILTNVYFENQYSYNFFIIFVKIKENTKQK